MRAEAVPAGLRERLGEEATGGLVRLFDNARSEWKAEVLSVAAERFEHRLLEETSKLRLEMAQGFASLRVEMAQGSAALRQEMAAQHASLLRWAFLFWVGQLGTVAGLMALMLR